MTERKESAATSTEVKLIEEFCKPLETGNKFEHLDFKGSPLVRYFANEGQFKSFIQTIGDYRSPRFESDDPSHHLSYNLSSLVQGELEFVDLKTIINVVSSASDPNHLFRRVRTFSAVTFELKPEEKFFDLYRVPKSQIIPVLKQHKEYLKRNRTRLIKHGWTDDSSGEWGYRLDIDSLYSTKTLSETVFFPPEDFENKKYGGRDITETGKQAKIPDAVLERVETLRPKLVDLKVLVTETLIKSIQSGVRKSLWEICSECFVNSLSAEEMEFLLFVDNHTATVKDGMYFFGFAGSNISMLIFFIHVIDFEISNGLYELQSVVNQSVKGHRSYYQIDDTPLAKNINEKLDHIFEIERLQDKALKDFTDQVNATIENEFYEEVVIKKRVKRKVNAKFVPYMDRLADLTAIQLETDGSLPSLQISASSPNQGVKKIFEPSPDYRSVTLRGTTFALTPKQADVIRVLHEAHKKELSELHQDDIINSLSEQASTTLKDIFKRKKKSGGGWEQVEAWGNLIVKGSKAGFFKLNI